MELDDWLLIGLCVVLVAVIAWFGISICNEIKADNTFSSSAISRSYEDITKDLGAPSRKDGDNVYWEKHIKESWVPMPIYNGHSTITILQYIPGHTEGWVGTFKDNTCIEMKKL